MVKKFSVLALACVSGIAFAQTSLDYRGGYYMDTACSDPAATYPTVQLYAPPYCDLLHGNCLNRVSWQGPNTATANFQMNLITVDNPQGWNAYYAGTTCHANSTIASQFGEGINNVYGSNRVLIPTQVGGVDQCNVRDPGRFKVSIKYPNNNCGGTGDTCVFNEKSASWEFSNDMVRYYVNSGFNVYNDSFYMNVDQYRAYDDGQTTAVVTFNYQCTVGGITTNSSIQMPISVYN